MLQQRKSANRSDLSNNTNKFFNVFWLPNFIGSLKKINFADHCPHEIAFMRAIVLSPHLPEIKNLL